MDLWLFDRNVIGVDHNAFVAKLNTFRAMLDAIGFDHNTFRLVLDVIGLDHNTFPLVLDVIRIDHNTFVVEQNTFRAQRDRINFDHDMNRFARVYSNARQITRESKANML